MQAWQVCCLLEISNFIKVIESREVSLLRQARCVNETSKICRMCERHFGIMPITKVSLLLCVKSKFIHTSKNSLKVPGWATKDYSNNHRACSSPWKSGKLPLPPKEVSVKYSLKPFAWYWWGTVHTSCEIGTSSWWKNSLCSKTRANSCFSKGEREAWSLWWSEQWWAYNVSYTQPRSAEIPAVMGTQYCYKNS